jgi:hypothetical protein
MMSGKRWKVGLSLLAQVGFLVLPLGAVEAPNFDGQPVFAEGTDRGYYVWRAGDQWHVRWTTLGAMHRFTGSVTAEGGDLKDLDRIDVEKERTIIRRGRPGRMVVGPRGHVRVRGGRAPVVVTKEQDKIEKEGDSRIQFVAHTDDDIDGFDFKVDSNVTLLRFNLEIDGASPPLAIEIGRNNRHPANNPFVADLK